MTGTQLTKSFISAGAVSCSRVLAVGHAYVRSCLHFPYHCMRTHIQTRKSVYHNIDIPSIKIRFSSWDVYTSTFYLNIILLFCFCWFLLFHLSHAEPENHSTHISTPLQEERETQRERYQVTKHLYLSTFFLFSKPQSLIPRRNWTWLPLNYSTSTNLSSGCLIPPNKQSSSLSSSISLYH